jgi:hypothetical protein
MVNLKQTIAKLNDLSLKMMDLSSRLRNMGHIGEATEVVTSWYALNQILQELTLLDQGIDIQENQIKNPLPGDPIELIKENLSQDKEAADRKIKTANLRYNKALQVYNRLKDFKPDEEKEEDEKDAEGEKPKPKPKKKPAKNKEVTPKEVKKLADERTKVVDKNISNLEKAVEKSQNELGQAADDFVDELDKDDDGNLRNTLANKRRLALWDRVYDKYIQESGVQVIKVIAEGVNSVLQFNGKYYGVFTTKAQLGKILTETKESIGDWLGITKRGGLVENGYLSRLLNDPTIRNNVRDSIFKSVVAQKGFFETKKGLRDFIAGNPQQAGALQKYYRNFVFDTFSQVDRTQAKIFADKLGFKYAIYEGGLIKTSREFCRKRNGKVFSREEIERFNPTEAKPPNYNPVTDLGGYGCRHHLNWVPDAVAFALRPELREKIAA